MTSISAQWNGRPSGPDYGFLTLDDLDELVMQPEYAEWTLARVSDSVREHIEVDGHDPAYAVMKESRELGHSVKQGLLDLVRVIIELRSAAVSHGLTDKQAAAQIGQGLREAGVPLA